MDGEEFREILRDHNREHLVLAFASSEVRPISFDPEQTAYDPSFTFSLDELLPEDAELEMLREAGRIKGVRGAALVDCYTGACNGMTGDVSVRERARGHASFVSAKLRLAEILGSAGEIEEILMLAGDHCDLVRPLPDSSVFLYVDIDMNAVSLESARRALRALGDGLAAPRLAG